MEEVKTPLTLLELCEKYGKIEIPVLQRNYVQGSVEAVREKFVGHLVDALEKKTPIELDFVYGAERAEKTSEGKEITVMIPLDGQQRLTTLWLLHGYLIAKDGAMTEELRDLLSRFVYETRPSAKAFCLEWLREIGGLTEEQRVKLLTEPSKYLKNRSWFDPHWLQDATVASMLGMLDEFARHSKRLEGKNLSDLNLIKFYHLPLQKFGLSNELYIRMNARGEQLTPFEHFKSTFYKVIQDHPNLNLEDIKRRMEEEWVNDLWDYRPEDAYVTDQPFMNLLAFVTEACDLERKADNDYKALTDVSFVEKIYKNPDHADLLVSALDALPELKKIEKPAQLLGESFSAVLNSILRGEFKDVNMDERILMYTAVRYIQCGGEVEEIEALLRVVRNLSRNTNSKTLADLIKLYTSVNGLVHELTKREDSVDVYGYLASQGALEILPAFYGKQVDEEIWKAKLRLERREEADLMTLLDEIEDYLGGRIRAMLCAVMGVSELEEATPNQIDYQLLRRVFSVYKERWAKDRLKSLHGVMLLEEEVHVYKEWDGRLALWETKRFADNWRYALGLMRFLVGFVRSDVESIDDYLVDYERGQIKRLYKETGGSLTPWMLLVSNSSFTT